MKNFLKNITKTDAKNSWDNIFNTGKPPTGKAADSGYTPAKKQGSQQANRQALQNFANDLTQSVKQSFGGLKNDSETQRNLALASKQGVGTNWSPPKRAVGNAIESAAANSVSSYLNAAGTMLQDDRKHGLAVDSDKVSKTPTGTEWYNRAGSSLQRGADKVQRISENAYARGAANLNRGERLLYDAGIAGAQMLGDMATGIAPVSMAVRSFGSGAKQARDAGATHTQQLLYGGASAAVELLTEKLFGGVAGIYGKGAADEAVSNAAKKLAKSPSGQAWVRSLTGMGLEGAEEVISGAVNPALQTTYNGKSIGENYRELDTAELLYEGVIGALLGGLGGGVDVAPTMSSNLRSAPSVTRNNAEGSLYGASDGALRSGLENATLLVQSGARNEAGLYNPDKATHNVTKPITSYTDALQAPMQSTPDGDVLNGKGVSISDSNSVNNTGTVAPVQGGSYADMFRQIMTGQDIVALGANKNADTSELARYKELGQKYLDGSISPQEADELWRLERIRSQPGAIAEDTEGTDTLTYGRYRELECKRLAGNITEQEFDKLRRFDSTLEQADTSVKHADSNSEEGERSQIENTTDRQNEKWGQKIKFSGGKHYLPADMNNSKDIAAAKEYRKISRNKKDISAISRNTGFSESEISLIKRHIFFEKHKKYDGYGLLDPDYDMAVAWKRLVFGNFWPRDIMLLKHELLESRLEEEYNLTIAEAHARAKTVYDWEKELFDAVGKDGEKDGLL